MKSVRISSKACCLKRRAARLRISAEQLRVRDEQHILDITSRINREYRMECIRGKEIQLQDLDREILELKAQLLPYEDKARIDALEYKLRRQEKLAAKVTRRLKQKEANGKQKKMYIPKVFKAQSGENLVEPISGGYFLLTQRGEALFDLTLEHPVLVVGPEGEVLTVLTRKDFMRMPWTVKDRPVVSIRDAGMEVISSIQNLKPQKSSSKLREAHKALTRKGLAFGLDGIGHANPNLEYKEVAISATMAKRMKVRAGQHVLITRIPQGSGTAALVEVTVQVSNSEGIQLTPELALLLGGDFDSDRYYLYRMNVNIYGQARNVDMDVRLLFLASLHPGVLAHLPSQKVTQGHQDRLQVMARKAVGAFTTMGYQAIMLMLSLKAACWMADHWFPSQELIFDLKKLDINANIVEDILKIMSTPLRSRYLAMADFAMVTVTKLEEKDADDCYITAFKWLYEAAMTAHENVQKFIPVLENANNDNEHASPFTEEEKELLLRVPYLEPGVVPDLTGIQSLIEGKGAKWRGNDFSNLLAKEKGEKEPEPEPSYPKEDHDIVLQPHKKLMNRHCRPIGSEAYLLGGPTSNICVIRETKEELLVLLNWERSDRVLQRIPLLRPVQMAGIPIKSGSLRTGAISGNYVINAVVTELGVLDPLQYILYLLKKELDIAFAKNATYLRENLLSRKSMLDVRSAIRSAVRTWKQGADQKREDEVELAYQLKSIRIVGTQDSSLTALKQCIGDEWEYRSTKNGDKGHILPVPGTEMYETFMHLMYQASPEYSKEISAHRVNSEQLPSHNRGTGMCNILVWDVPGLTFGTCASSLDALKIELGQKGETGCGATDSGILFSELPYTFSQSMSYDSRWDANLAQTFFEQDGLTITRVEDTVELHGALDEVYTVQEGGSEYPNAARISLKVRGTKHTTPGHAYKMMFGPGAKGMFLYSPAEVTATVGGHELPITAAVSMTSLKSKNARQACLDGIARITGPVRTDDMLHTLQTMGSDVEGRFPVTCDGQFVGYFSILRVPYWMLPADTECTRVRMEPWVSPLANSSPNASKVDLCVRDSVLEDYMKAMLLHKSAQTRAQYLSWCKKNSKTPDLKTIGELQIHEIRFLTQVEFETVAIDEMDVDETNVD